jgi:hypothetical protein
MGQSPPYPGRTPTSQPCPSRAGGHWDLMGFADEQQTVSDLNLDLLVVVTSY